MGAAVGAAVGASVGASVEVLLVFSASVSLSELESEPESSFAVQTPVPAQVAALACCSSDAPRVRKAVTGVFRQPAGLWVKSISSTEGHSQCSFTLQSASDWQALTLLQRRPVTTREVSFLEVKVMD